MSNTIRVELVKYRYHIDGYQGREHEIKDYQNVLRDIKEQGHAKSWKCYYDMGQVNKSFYQSLPEVVEIKTDHLFDNQFNTKCGKRIFLWIEHIFPNKDIKEGYYLRGEGLRELREAQQNQLACGYCGARYDARTTDRQFCDSCLDSRYLTKNNLHLLRLLPVISKESRPKEITEELKAEYEQGRKQLEVNQKERMKRKAKELLEDLERKQKLDRYETQVKHDLLMVGISTDNLIYYAHKDQWCYGWKDSVTNEQFNEFRQLCTEHGIDLINKLEKGNK